MLEADDHDLLGQYVRQKSEEAFASLVKRHVNLVYSVALRHTTDRQSAEDIVQAVFLLLAKKAASLSSRTIVSGWLYRAAQLTAANYTRSEIRRKRREQEVQMQSFANEPEPDGWTQMAPMLDTAMARLRDRERDAIVLRFFEGKSNSEAGDALGMTEAAAQKCVERALAKLRGFFTRRGLAVPAATLAASLSAHSVQAAPVSMAVSVMTGITKGASAQVVAPALMKSTLKIMTWLKVKTALTTGVSAILVAVVATCVVIQAEKVKRAPSPGVVVASPPPQTKPRPPVLDKQADADSGNAATAEPAGSAPPAPGAENAILADSGNHGHEALFYIRRGKVYLANSAYDSAIADFNRALQIDPKSAAANFNLGRAHKLSGDFAKALDDYTQAIQLDPGMAPAYVNRGQILNMAKRYVGSITDFDKAIALAPGLPLAYLNRGVAFGAEGDYGKAQADFEKAIALAPNFPPGYNNLAWLEATCPQAAFRDGEDAVRNATKACQLSQWQKINQIDTLAAASAEAGDFDSAIKWETGVLQSSDLAPADLTTARERLALYQDHQPYRRPSPTTTQINP